MLFRRRNQDEAMRLLGKQVHDLGVRLTALEEKHEALQSAHEALRGRFYQARQGSQPPPPQTKADILRAAGWTPGKPFPHT